MKKSAFTMIELIFVIVILGILAAIAVPRMTQTQDLARETNVEGFVGSLNRSAAADMWIQAITDGNGSVGTGSYNIASFMEIPTGYEVANDLAGCANGATVLNVTTAVIGKAQTILCRDGNLTSPPKFGFKLQTNGDMNVTVQ